MKTVQSLEQIQKRMSAAADDLAAFQKESHAGLGASCVADLEFNVQQVSATLFNLRKSIERAVTSASRDSTKK